MIQHVLTQSMSLSRNWYWLVTTSPLQLSLEGLPLVMSNYDRIVLVAKDRLILGFYVVAFMIERRCRAVVDRFKHRLWKPMVKIELCDVLYSSAYHSVAAKQYSHLCSLTVCFNKAGGVTRHLSSLDLLCDWNVSTGIPRKRYSYLELPTDSDKIQHDAKYYTTFAFKTAPLNQI